MKIGLGTAQFGLDYGISNGAGRVSQEEVRSILTFAAETGIEMLDTAVAYGEAERVVGNHLQSATHFRLVTKLPRVPAELPPQQVLDWVRQQLSGSLDRLGQSSLYGLLVHGAQDLLGSLAEPLFSALLTLQDEGLVKKVGASVYTAAEIDGLLGRFALDIVQLPINLLDQRLLESGHLQKLRQRGVEIHARSLFLQGLLLMDPDTLPEHFFSAVPALKRFRTALRQLEFTPLQAAVAFAHAIPEIDIAVFGVTCCAELREIVSTGGTGPDIDWYRPFGLTDEKILNPALWPAR